MVQLKYVSSLDVESWERTGIKELAAANQDLTITKSYNQGDYVIQSCSLEYLDFVKELNPNYTGKGVRFKVTQDEEVSKLVAHVSHLRQKYPELDLFLDYGKSNTPINLDIGIEIENQVDIRIPSQLRPRVKHIVLDTRSEAKDLADYKNIESICIEKLDLMSIGIILPYIVSKLKRLKIIVLYTTYMIEGSRKLNGALLTEKFLALRQVIDHYPLIEIFLNGQYGECNDAPDREVIGMVLNSPMKTMKIIKLQTITVDSIDGGFIELEQDFNCRDLLPALLNRFKKVNKIFIRCPDDHEHDGFEEHDWVKVLFSNVVLSNKRQTFKVTCKHCYFDFANPKKNVDLIF